MLPLENLSDAIASWVPPLGGAALLAILYPLMRIIYLLYFHPAFSFKGPTFAALSTWWLYSINKAGRAEQVFEQLHRKYNTRALRIGPNEIHISDSTLYHTIYSQDHVYTKDPYFYDAFGTPHSVFVETDRELHRQRRKCLSRFFSKASVRERAGGGKEPINIYNAARCLTIDVISDVAFGHSLNTLGNSNGNSFESSFLQALDVAAYSIWDMMFFPQLRVIAGLMPPGLTMWLGGPAAHFARQMENIKKIVKKFQDLKSVGKTFDHPVVFDHLSQLDSTSLVAEATDILVAGSDTTATTLAVALHQLACLPEVYTALKNELQRADLKTSDDYDLTRIDQFPYLAATVKESLRFATAVPGRLPRVVPSPQSRAGVLKIDGQVVPEGTIVGISAYTVHFDESIWGSDARKFNPDRWLSDDKKDLDKYLVPFSKGARQCLGINLANAELTLALAMLMSRFDIVADETMTDVDLYSFDGFTISFKDGSGPRVKFLPLNHS
ncbi:hypothetical protein G7054_g4763 [Neopestalotiopsis clavispora]|nr:hypothetical protein G7054_g4763 [Neopestalotiopsis clavispora]